MGRRTLLLLAAIIVAAVGTSLVFLYARSADARAVSGQRMVEVLVVTKEIPAGTRVADAQAAGSFEKRDVVASSVATGALGSTASVSDLVVLSPMYPGEQLLSAKVGQPRDQARLPIPPGKLGLSVQLSDPARVADFVAPGSEVAVFATVTPKSGSGAGAQTTRLLLPRVTVLAVGATTTQTTTTTADNGQQQTQAVPKTILTLALTQSEAQKLVFASQSGQLYFGLLTESSRVSPGAGTSDSNLFG